MDQTQPSEQIPQTQTAQSVQVSAPGVKPYLTYTLLGLTIFIYLLQLAGQYLFQLDLVTAFAIKYNPLIRDGQLWRLITPVFLHGSVLHIGFNMYALFIYGRGLETRFGHFRFGLLYFLSAFAGNVFSFLLTPNPSLGASTAIFGLLAAEGIFVFQNRKLFSDRANRVLLNVLYVAGINLFIGFNSPGVDVWGHVGGMLGGILFTWFGGPRLKVEGFFPSVQLVDERSSSGALAGTVAVLLFFIPLAALGWIWIVK